MNRLAGTSLMITLAGAALGHASSVQGYSSAVVDTVLKAKNTNASGQQKAIVGTATGSSGIGVEGVGTAYGLHGAGAFKGVYGEHTGGGAGYGVDGFSANGFGVRGETNDGTGVFAQGQGNGDAVVGNAYGAGVGARGTSSTGNGAEGISTDGYGVSAISSNNYGGRFITYAPGYSGISTSNLSSNGSGIYAEGTTGVDGRGSPANGYVSYGVQGYADASSISYGYGVNAAVQYGDYNYGVYASAYGANYQGWAGYFDGDVAITGTCYPCVISDANVKKNVQDIKGSLARIMTLRPKSYEMKTDEYAGKVNMGKGLQHGLIAQELEAVYPEVVHAVMAPAQLTPDERRKGVRKEGTLLKSVNYTALIPMLIQAIQEQQQEIEALKAAR